MLSIPSGAVARAAADEEELTTGLLACVGQRKEGRCSLQFKSCNNPSYKSFPSIKEGIAVTRHRLLYRLSAADIDRNEVLSYLGIHPVNSPPCGYLFPVPAGNEVLTPEGSGIYNDD